ncbi:MAG TPA: hypothetical protein PK264_21425, partial [Hyphomicrobiaceae bacterium]|nr:hypothetical protein [Hyphomicrobiaceae bacterium]
AFWRQTVIPLATRTGRALATWLAPGEGLALRPDLDAIEALSSEREALWSRLEAASFLTANEKRAAAGYGEIDDDALAAKFNPYHDALGRFTTGPGLGDVGQRRGPSDGKPKQPGPPEPAEPKPGQPKAPQATDKSKSP